MITFGQDFQGANIFNVPGPASLLFQDDEILQPDDRSNRPVQSDINSAGPHLVEVEGFLDKQVDIKGGQIGVPQGEDHHVLLLDPGFPDFRIGQVLKLNGDPGPKTDLGQGLQSFEEVRAVELHDKIKVGCRP